MGCGSSSSSNVNVAQPRFIVAKDYVEIEGKFVGEGVKVTKAWEATITPTVLNAKRMEFWQSFKGNGRASTLYLKQAAEADPPTAKVLLVMGGFALENGNMSVCISPRGHRYELPPFILADPVRFKETDALVVEKKKVVEGVVKIKLRTVFNVKEDIFEVDNSIMVKELKGLYFEKNSNSGVDVRLFFGGKELQDSRTLMSYGIENEMTILVYKKTL